MAQRSLVCLVKEASRRWGRSFGASETNRMLPCLYSLSRTFSSKLFVGGLSYHTTEEMARNAFAQHGEVVDVRIITDRETGQSRGFGFITFASESEAENARSKMNNHLLDGRFIRVDLASNRPPQSSSVSPRPSGNAASSSSSVGSITFSNPGARPPSVEDWSPLPFRGGGQTTQTSIQETFENQRPSDTGSIGTDGSPSSASGPQSACISSSFASSQSSSISGLRNDNFDAAASNNAESFISQKTAVSTDGSGGPPNFQSNMSLQGMNANGGPALNVAANSGQSVLGRGSPEAGSSPSQTAKIKLDSFTSGSRSGSRSGAGRPPSVINLGSATYDFSNFPEFDASVLKKSKLSGELEEPKIPVPPYRSKLAPKKAESWEKKLTEEAIPPAEGPLYNFGLSLAPELPAPPSNAGCSRHGAFSLSVNLNELPEAEPVRLPYSIFTARTLPPLDLPWLTPEADNWSPIGKPPRRIEDSPYSPFSPDLKDDPEFWWDPYDFDPDAKLLKEAVNEEASVEANATNESELQAKKLDETESEAKIVKEAEPENKLSKELEADEVLAAKVARS